MVEEDTSTFTVPTPATGLILTELPLFLQDAACWN